MTHPENERTQPLGIESSWQAALGEVASGPWRATLRALLEAEASAGATVYPPRSAIFRAFERTPFAAVRAVILGQDPYHGPGQAMGLSFSVPRGCAIPPSLRNILRELEHDLGIAAPSHGDLAAWADRGVLLLNSTLTVRAGAAASHAGKGWEQVTDAAIRALSEQRDHVAFVLWGRHAQAKRPLIDAERHLIVASPHPSPLSARNGFFGSRPFSRINDYLIEHGNEPIGWRLPA